jgi:hypothetical protein
MHATEKTTCGAFTNVLLSPHNTCPCINSDRTECCTKSVRSEQVMAQLEQSMSWLLLNVTDSPERRIRSPLYKVRQGLDDHGPMIGSERLLQRLRATVPPYERSLALTWMTQRIEGELKGLAGIAFALVLLLLRCECEKSFHYRMTAPHAPAWPLYPFGPHLLLQPPTVRYSGSG